MKTILGICAIAALGLSGCNSSNDGGIAGSAEDGFGNPIGTPIQGLAAFIGADGPVAAHDAVAVTFNADGSFTVTTPAGDDLVFSGDGVGRFDPVLGDDIFQFTNTDGDTLEVVHGFDAAENAIYDIARINEAGSADGFEIYGVIGNETEAANLPTGTATYEGAFLASLFSEGVAFTDEFRGTSIVTADFGASTVTNAMDGSYVVDGVIFTGFMDSTATLSGSQYVGNLSGSINTPELGWEFETLDIDITTGALAGAFYGLTGEATAGAFAGRDIWFDPTCCVGATIHPLEIVGGFAAGIVPAP